MSTAAFMEAADPVFRTALGRSLVLAGAVGGVSFALGWPLGVASGIWRCRGEKLWLMVLMIPLLLPTFLLAIGLSMLRWGVDGFCGTLLAHACAGVPLVLLAARLAMASITRSQADAARLGGGERMLFEQSLRAAVPTAGLAAMLAGVMTLSDPGPGQIFGWPGAAGQLLVSFAAQYDRTLAMQQALWMAAAALLLTAIPAWRWAPALAMQVGARDLIPMQRRQKGWLSVALVAVALLVVALPLAGLCLPLSRHPASAWPLARAWGEFSRTAADTLLYAALAAALAVAVGFVLAAVAGQRRRRLVFLMLIVLAIPPALPALALIPWSHGLTLSVALALRGFPIALLLGMRAWGSMSSTWADAARVHCVPRLWYALRVILPWMSRWAWPAAAIAALLATAEIGTVLLLHPPGHGTLPLAIFTIMANAPEALVAMLCLLYVTIALTVALMAGRFLLKNI